MNKIAELFGHSASQQGIQWEQMVADERCVYMGKKCYKVRKSQPDVSIGTCTVLYGKDNEPIVICPTRLIDRQQIFLDCLHLLTNHEPGNEIHIVPEVSVPGGTVDYFLSSVRGGRVKDFIGIELQTLDTTGTVWPERQRLLKTLGIAVDDDDAVYSQKSFGMNWKMTAKTILVQIHHKIETFENINKRLVLVLQDKLLDYMFREFDFVHLQNPARIGDSMHFHSYRVEHMQDMSYRLQLHSRFSTDVDGVAKSLGLQAEAKVDLQVIIQALESKISPATMFQPVIDGRS